MTILHQPKMYFFNNDLTIGSLKPGTVKRKPQIVRHILHFAHLIFRQSPLQRTHIILVLRRRPRSRYGHRPLANDVIQRHLRHGLVPPSCDLFHGPQQRTDSPRRYAFAVSPSVPLQILAFQVAPSTAYQRRRVEYSVLGGQFRHVGGVFPREQSHGEGIVRQRPHAQVVARVQRPLRSVPSSDETVSDLIGRQRHFSFRQVFLTLRDERGSVIAHADVLNESPVVALGQSVPVDGVVGGVVPQRFEGFDDVGHLDLVQVDAVDSESFAGFEAGLDDALGRRSPRRRREFRGHRC